MKGLIFNIKRYAIHDGPGIRVTFFMKGCPLSCWWCHNPEGISPEPEEIIQVNRVGDHEFSKKETAGRYIEVGEVISILEKERVFIERSKGGVTFSGGEPMMQFDFLLEALRECTENGFHTAVDTSGHFARARLKAILPHTSLFLFDLKHLDKDKHSLYTGVSNRTILGNLQKIAESGTEIMLRIPVIPGINDDEEHLGYMKKYINSIKGQNIKTINLLPYHKSGTAKYRKFNRENKMESVAPPSGQRMQQLKEYFSDTGIKVKIGG
jgi:pyruvate formate lyase activating enzyme